MSKTRKGIDIGDIEIRGNRVNNLKNIDVSIPRGKLTVVTGVSGSGKSSLAFDTLYAEGQRRYVESLSSYARQFLNRMPKPDCDFIRYIPPAVAIQQRVISRNPRSTVGTITEIYDYLKMLFARFGRTYSPISGDEVKKHTVHDVVAFSKTLEEGTRFLLLAPVHLSGTNTLQTQLQLYQSSGFSRIAIGNKVYYIDEVDNTLLESGDFYLLVDRLSVRREDATYDSRLADSAEIAFYEGHGECYIAIATKEGYGETFAFSNRFEADRRLFVEPTPELFDFNSPTGACPRCEGYGKTIGIAPELVIPQEGLSVYEGAVACWSGPKSSGWRDDFFRAAKAYGFPIHTPYNQLTEAEKSILWKGITDPEEGMPAVYGIDAFFAMLHKDRYKVQNRVRIAHFSGKTTCPLCQGRRLKEDAFFVLFEGKKLYEITSMSIADARVFFEKVDLPTPIAEAAQRLLFEIRSRLSVLCDVGLEYLTLDRPSNTLSGGESQRVTLATRLGSNLYGAMYVLDEPSIGLHERDTKRLISVIERLRDAGNTLVVVEHDENMMQAADYLIDIGPDAGSLGGEIVFAGAPSEITAQTPGYTAAFLSQKATIPLPLQRRRWHKYIEVRNAAKNNLKNLTVRIPLEVMTVVTGVSGSGKSTLVRDTLFEELSRLLDEPTALHGQIISGDISCIKDVEYVDQNSAGRNARSNPVTYIGAYDAIRSLYSELPLSKQMGYAASMFSFNREGGRCEECKGEGVVTIEMQFMADLTLTCEACEGKRFRREILDVCYHDKNIYDLLNMTINEAVAFFQEFPSKGHTESIISLLSVLQKVGLGYLKMGQNSSSLSGGENQRLKLAYYLSKTKKEPSLFIFDEPTTGLHFQDISVLMKALNALIDQGHSVLVIEHNLDVVKCADYVIDMGPEGGVNGGTIVAQGTPEEIAEVEASYTGAYLRKKLK
ncbi:excinuclease ABC subunit UvrA [Porphyromonas circumdentaria]|uniref:UvrABC system protein A n=1 Tax=Porphyromonas circumdentaria TaxID=29524 RepID=A0A1T4NDJ9_9PORP|nr:excinuclease ABC subunit UvrA [Porphyromonas circumdentaria]MBB6275637.1 excinuclease ABC subunit A [Porphyromonas circumdentaria]MDO4721877.1 excinuclease ABC subunit UvrA [Porphyromonas circumdentaria]SJZ77213.1 Excinuclease ABC subunit A [Porphyromonas circumdentaria]